VTNNHSQKASVAMFSVISNSILVILKLVVGSMIGSVSVISEAIHSSVDLLAAIIALFAVRTSDKPADHGHPFGHGKVENLSGTIEALLIFLAAGWIMVEAVKRLQKPEPLDEVVWGIIVMVIASLANILVSQKLFQVGKETDSVALQADAWHLRTDVYTSAGVLAGLFVIWAGGMIFPDLDLRFIDPIVAIAVALLIIKAAFKLTVESARDLLDVSLPSDEEAHIRKHISSFAPAVRGFHRLRTRKSGSYRFVEFHMLVDAEMSVDESHRITDMLTRSIQEHYPDSTITIHIEPCNGECTTKCHGDCLLNEKDRKAIRARNKILAG
jgi:cation diffusion facilitator family transporter